MRRHVLCGLALLMWLAAPLEALAGWGEQAPLQFKLSRTGGPQADEILRLSYNVNLGGVRATSSSTSTSGSTSTSSSGTSNGTSSGSSSNYSSSTSADYYGGSSAAQLQEPTNYNNAVLITENITITLNGDGNVVTSNGQTWTMSEGAILQTSETTSQTGENSASGNNLN